MSENNALRINLDRKKIEEIKLDNINDKTIKKNIKKFSFLPIVLEKIVMEYDNNLTMITELNTETKKAKKGFYFKGFYISSNALILKTSFINNSNFIEYSKLDDIEYSKDYLNNRVIFDIENASEPKKLQVQIIDLILDCGINPFDTISFYDNKYILRVKKIIDAVDILSSDTSNNILEILKSVKKTLSIASRNDNLQEKRAICTSILQQMCTVIAL